MTDHSHDRAAARELRDLTDRPYQACLTAVRVLRPLADRIDLGDLASVFGRSDDGGRLIAVPVDAVDINPRVTYDGSPVRVPADSDVILSTLPRTGEMIVHFSLVPAAGELPAGCRLFLETSADRELRPHGMWRLPVSEFIGTVRRHEPIMRATVCDWCPPSMDDCRPDSYLTEFILTAPATDVVPGPGFPWHCFSFEALALVSDEPRCPGDDCFGQCGQLHDWPAADPTRRGIVVPEPLLRYYRQLVTAEDWALDACPNEHSYRVTVRDDPEPTLWFGLDMPESIDTLWLSVPRPPRDLLPPRW